MLTNSSVSLEERADLPQSERKLWRTLVRVSSLDKERVGLIIPAWNAHQPVYFAKNQFPDDIREKIGEGYRFHAYCNIGVKNTMDLYLDIFVDH